MKRMLRWAVNFATAVSAFLFVAICALWVRSYWFVYTLQEQRPGTTVPEWGSLVLPDNYEYWVAAIIPGRIIFLSGWYEDANPPQSFGWVFYTIPASQTSRYGYKWVVWQSRRRAMGFEVGRWQFGGCGGTLAAVPLWSLMLMASVLPACYALRRAKTGRSAGVCPACGYDLRATLDRCPECGAVPFEKGQP